MIVPVTPCPRYKPHVQACYLTHGTIGLAAHRTAWHSLPTPFYSGLYGRSVWIGSSDAAVRWLLLSMPPANAHALAAGGCPPSLACGQSPSPVALRLSLRGTPPNRGIVILAIFACCGWKTFRISRIVRWFCATLLPRSARKIVITQRRERPPRFVRAPRSDGVFLRREHNNPVLSDECIKLPQHSHPATPIKIVRAPPVPRGFIRSYACSQRSLGHACGRL